MATLLVDQGLPGNIRVPFLYFGVDNSLAGYYQNNTRCLVFGQMLAAPAGTATADVAIQVFGNEDKLFGRGSMLSSMIKKLRLNNATADIWAVPLADRSTVKSTWTITVGAVTAISEPISILIAGVEYRISKTATDTAITIAAKIRAAIIADVNAPVVVTAATTNIVTLTARHAGLDAGKINIRQEYRRQRIAKPSTVLTIAQTVVGAANPLLTTAIANLANEPFDFVCMPYTDTVSLAVISDEFNDVTGRWNAMQQLYGHVFSTINGTPAERTTIGTTLNSQHLTVLGINGSPTPAYDIAAALTAKAQLHLSDAPELSRPLQTIKLQGVLAPEIELVDDATIRQTMHYNGIAGVTVARDGSVLLDRVVTTYRTNAYGSPDPSYLDVQVLAQLQYFIRYMQQKLSQTFPRHALRSDDEDVVPGSYVVTPRILKSYLVAWAEELSRLNVVENIERFISLVQVERDETDPKVVNMIVRPDLVDQFMIGKMLVQFFNQYPVGAIPGLE